MSFFHHSLCSVFLMWLIHLLAHTITHIVNVEEDTVLPFSHSHWLTKWFDEDFFLLVMYVILFDILPKIYVCLCNTKTNNYVIDCNSTTKVLIAFRRGVAFSYSYNTMFVYIRLFDGDCMRRSIAFRAFLFCLFLLLCFIFFWLLYHHHHHHREGRK